MAFFGTICLLSDCQFKLFGQQWQNMLRHCCQAVKYGRIVTPAITRRLVGWCLPYFSSRPILVGVVICLHPCWCLLYFFQPSDITFRAAFVCIGSLGHAPKQKSVYIQKNAKIVCYLVTNG